MVGDGGDDVVSALVEAPSLAALPVPIIRNMLDDTQLGARYPDNRLLMGDIQVGEQPYTLKLDVEFFEHTAPPSQTRPAEDRTPTLGTTLIYLEGRHPAGLPLRLRNADGVQSITLILRAEEDNGFSTLRENGVEHNASVLGSVEALLHFFITPVFKPLNIQ